MIKAVVFDYGGTLVRPSIPWDVLKPKAIAASYRLLASKGLKLSLAEYLSIDETFFAEYSKLEQAQGRDIPDSVSYRELVKRLFPKRPISWVRETTAEANRAFWRVAVNNYAPRDDARDCLSRLESAGLRLAVISNHHHHEGLTGHLEELGLAGFFSRIYCSSDLEYRKPDPRIFKRCLSALRVKPHQAVFVGDSPVQDIGGAKGVGMHTILIVDRRDRGLLEPGAADHVVTTLGEIPDIVLSMA